MSTATLDHPMSTIANGAYKAFDKAEATSHTHVSIAATLSATFGAPEQTQNKVSVLLTIVSDGVTPEEFATCLKDAQKNCRDADELNGWQAPKDAKGRDKYGPRQSSFASHASAARQVFGALKHVGPESIGILFAKNGIVMADTIPSFKNAADKARKALADKGITWEGRAVSAEDAAKARKHDFQQQEDARKMAEQANPQEHGESMAAYDERIGLVLDVFKDKVRDAELTAIGVKLWDKLAKHHNADDLDVILRAALTHGGHEIA